MNCDNDYDRLNEAKILLHEVKAVIVIVEKVPNQKNS